MGVSVLVDVKPNVVIKRGVTLHVGISRSLDDWRQRARADNLLQRNALVARAVISTSLSDRIKS